MSHYRKQESLNGLMKSFNDHGLAEGGSYTFARKIPIQAGSKPGGTNRLDQHKTSRQQSCRYFLFAIDTAQNTKDVHLNRRQRLLWNSRDGRSDCFLLIVNLVRPVLELKNKMSHQRLFFLRPRLGHRADG